MPKQFGDKTHDATPHRRQQARQEGQVARSQDLSSAALLVAAIGLLYWLGPGIAQSFASWMTGQWENVAPGENDADTAVALGHQALTWLAMAIGPLLGLLAVVAAVVNIGQVGFLFLPQKLAFDASRVSPLKGFQRLFSMQNTVRLGFGLFKVAVVGGVAAWSLWAVRGVLTELGLMEVSEIAVVILQTVLGICLKVAVALLILAILEYGFQRWKHEQDLKMTTQEVREELKTLQGDPHIVARRRQIQRQLVLNRLNTIVPNADVVVTNPTELAVALKYDPARMVAPVVVTKGAGVIAQRIRRLALEHGVPIVERKELARALYRDVDINQAIPAEQYAAVAEVLRFVYELKGTPEALRVP